MDAPANQTLGRHRPRNGPRMGARMHARPNLLGAIQIARLLGEGGEAAAVALRPPLIIGKGFGKEGPIRAHT